MRYTDEERERQRESVRRANAARWAGHVKRPPKPKPAPRPCPHCGAMMDNPRRVQCGAPECARLARNLQMKLYMRKRDGSTRPFDCKGCGKVCVPGDNASIHAQVFCTRACLESWQRKMARRATRRPRAEARLARAALGTVGTATIYSYSCPECGAPFLSRHPPLEAGRYCSTACQRRQHRRRRRARKAGAGYKTLSFRSVADRDGWRCQLCGQTVDVALVVPHPLAPTLDHIVPLALGGAHSEDNAQLAHFICNSRKGDGSAVAVGGQLTCV